MFDGGKMRSLIFIFAGLIVVVPCQAKIIYVDDDAVGGGDGGSWENAYRFLQDALATASSDPNISEIWVAQGTYRPDEITADPNGTDDREATFQLVNGVALKGGYAGVGEIDANDRNWELYESVLSGDLEGDDGELIWPKDLLHDPNRIDNSFHVVTGSFTDPNTIIDGFTISGGNTESSGSDFYGAGMYNDSASLIITNCVFKINSAYKGGGIYCNSANPSISYCIFNNNTADEGGGICNWEGSSPLLTYCTFFLNLTSIDFDGWGGGMANRNSNPILNNCNFISNTAWDGLSGGMINFFSRPTLTNCIFWDNSDLFGNDESAQIGQEGGVININYSCVQGWTGILGGNGNINTDPNFVNPNNNDYHLQSQAGRYDPTTQSWITDSITSPCIDAGDPLTPIGWELYPNGGIINMGAYGGTTEASKSYFGTTPCEIPIAGDINGDCRVDLIDFSIMSMHWLEDNNI